MSEASAQQEIVATSVPEPRSYGRIVRRILSIRELGPFVLLIGMLVFFTLYNSGFASPRNVSNIVKFVPELGIIALGMTLLLTAGEFDLSVGAMFAFTQVTMFLLIQKGVMSLYPAFITVMALAVLNGLIIGVLVTKAHISSFLVTLAMMLILRGTSLYLTDGFQATISVENTVLSDVLVGSFKIGKYELLASLGWWLGLAAVLHFVLNETAFGNWIMATGGNAESARARGVSTDNVKISLFVLSSVLAAFASVISAARLDTAYPIAGDGYELEVIAMTVIGGTLLLGGRGTIIGTVIGAMILRGMRNGIIFVGIPGLAFSIFIGLIIIVMLLAHNALDRVVRLGEH